MCITIFCTDTCYVKFVTSNITQKLCHCIVAKESFIRILKSRPCIYVSRCPLTSFHVLGPRQRRVEEMRLR